MASGSTDYYLTISSWATSVKTVLDNSITKLTDVITALSNALTQQTGIHDDTTAMIDFSSEDTNGVTTGLWQLLSSVSPKRNMLRVNNTGSDIMDYSRDAGSTTEGTIAGESSATVYDSPGFWVKETVNPTTWTAHEEWAT